MPSATVPTTSCFFIFYAPLPSIYFSKAIFLPISSFCKSRRPAFIAKGSAISLTETLPPAILTGRRSRGSLKNRVKGCRTRTRKIGKRDRKSKSGSPKSENPPPEVVYTYPSISSCFSRSSFFSPSGPTVSDEASLAFFFRP